MVKFWLLIASASNDRTVKIWNLEGTCQKTLQGHRSRVWGVSYICEREILVSVSDDKTIKFWNLDGEEL
jgi:WD40 repeat protein